MGRRWYTFIFCFDFFIFNSVGIYYNAYITKVHPDGRCDVLFEDDRYSAVRLTPSQLQNRIGDEVGSIMPPMKDVTSHKTRTGSDVILIDGSDTKKKKREEVTDFYALISRFPNDCGVKVTGPVGKKELFCSFCSHTVTAISSSLSSHLKSKKHSDNKDASSKVNFLIIIKNIITVFLIYPRRGWRNGQ